MFIVIGLIYYLVVCLPHRWCGAVGLHIVNHFQNFLLIFNDICQRVVDLQIMIFDLAINFEQLIFR